MQPAIEPVRDYFLSLQDDICSSLEAVDAEVGFLRESLRTPGGGFAHPRVLENGSHLEKAAVQFSHSIGTSLPPAATERNPHLAGLGFQATSISLIVHPRNPYAPTTHMNLRFFLIEADDPVWYFGGGFDLTPYYGFVEDARHWHEQARLASGDFHQRMKTDCDKYFYLSHREECRGVGGIFFDDWTENGFEASFDLTRSVGDHFLPAYQPILERRIGMPYGDRERNWQRLRRGRYVEFNLAIDRGTRYGIQSGRRIESVLASMPPTASWRYDCQPEEGSEEARLLAEFLPPRDWLAEP
ncbi:MAG: oxygen-dependent coproporphyrinogen oxidase [Pseudomonadales bacterium]|jgi:coproporphyrinogen III oxidase|nr:oxygen-dependent coproporphyrinogen oxidase [Pseudomonadales bacterium]MDP6472998.1 oxygen-dependent coproporphyrinogen oxidase [Pseudomonadales bacterium]MDP6826245.1 oxygen-dependent coproporphyrinogen oxidase [Pseudomonadales bacterium]MDP6971931.1 oxygen-dependent coproporphyrinogen oxidase [Pseudomonadales bacterium]